MADSTPLRGASYARQSTVDQQTIPTQLNLCRKLLDDRGWKERFRLSDNALKGRDPTRPGYQRLLELAEDRRIDVIVAWRFDRLFRSLTEASAAHEHFEANNVSMISVTEPFDTTTSIGRFLFGSLANFAQFETDLLKERALLGYERRIHEGKWTGATPPFGYSKQADGTLVTEADEVAIVRIMVKKYAKCGGDQQLATHLNVKNKLRRGTPWTTNQVSRTLTNPLMFGALTQRGITANKKVLAIVTASQYRALQEQRRSFQHAGTHNPAARDESRLDDILTAYTESLQELEPPQMRRPGHNENAKPSAP